MAIDPASGRRSERPPSGGAFRDKEKAAAREDRRLFRVSLPDHRSSTDQVTVLAEGLLFGMDCSEIVSPALKAWVFEMSLQVVALLPKTVHVIDVFALLRLTVKA